MAEFRLKKGSDGEFPPLKVSANDDHSVVLVLGVAADSVTVPGSRFAFDSSFPTPGIAGAVRFAVEALDGDPSHQAAVFGHADSTGTDDYNKNLSDRRAAAFLAVLTNDPALFTRVADAENWGDDIYQAMLRALGPNPGPIDGKVGELTTLALRGFQDEYTRGVYHRDSERKAVGKVSVNGKLDQATKIALRDAYLAIFSAQQSVDRFIGPKRAGCSEFVPLDDKAEDNRRVTLAIFSPADAPKPEDFPCVEGDAKACPLDTDTGRRCPFYRQFVHEEDNPEFAGDAIPFFDFQWLKGSDTVAHLSAVTSLADGTEVTFRVLRAESSLDGVTIPDSSTEGSPPDLGTEQVSLTGTIKNGIAFVKWEHAADVDPFDVEQWAVDAEGNIGNELDDDTIVTAADLFNAIAQHPPLFEITTDGAWGLSAPPGHALNRVELSEDGELGLALTSAGFVVAFDAKQGRIDAADDVMIVKLGTTKGRPTPATKTGA
ncbi:MAG TPA: hypothetical protein VHM70_18200 [Polyangiaceae bacterium]|jgi:hypothetical protein|nr:hypothetical protein [Polyangiaceae bacterium]